MPATSAATLRLATAVPFIAALLSLIVAVIRTYALGAGPSPLLPPGRVDLRGTVDSPVQDLGSYALAMVRVDDSEPYLPGARVQAVLSPMPGIELGDRVLVVDELTPVAGLPQAPRLRSQGISAVAEFPQLTRLAPAEGPTGPQELILAVRGALEDALWKTLPEPQSSLASGLLVGAAAGLGPELRQALITSGTTHLVVVSGYNITLVAAASIALLRGSGWLAFVGPLLSIWAFTTLAGASPPAVRAAIMATITLAAVRFGRGTDPLGALALAVAGMLLWSPSLAGDVGFQLSAVATLGLITLQPRVAQLLGRMPGMLREPLAGTVAAQLAALPLLGFTFHQVSAVALLSNVLAAPAVPVITVLAGALGILVALLPPLAPLATVFLIGPTTFLLEVIQLTAAIPNALIPAPEVPAVLVVMYVIGLVVWAASHTPEGRDMLVWARSKRLILVGLAGLSAGLLVGTACTSFAAADKPQLSLTVFEAGGAHAVLGRGPGGQTFLFDAGRSTSRTTIELGRRLPATSPGLSLAILTSFDERRLPGMVAATERYPPALALAPRMTQPTTLTERWQRQLGERLVTAAGPIHLALSPGLEIDFWPGGAEASAVRVAFGRTSIVFAPASNQAAALGQALSSGRQPDVVMIPPWRSEAEAAPVRQVSLGAVVLLVDPATRGTAAEPAATGVPAATPVFRTDTHGTVSITSDGDRIWIGTAR